MKPYKNLSSIVIILLLSCLLLSNSVSAQNRGSINIEGWDHNYDDSDQIRSTNIYFSVTNSDSLPKTDLSQVDFSLFVDGTPTKIEYVKFTPINLIVMIDVSKTKDRTNELSVPEEEDQKNLEEVKISIMDFLSNKIFGNSWVQIYTFGKEYEEVVSPTMNLAQAISDLRNFNFNLESYPCFYSSAIDVLSVSGTPGQIPSVLLAVINGSKFSNEFQQVSECPTSKNEFISFYNSNANQPPIFIIEYGDKTDDLNSLNELDELTKGGHWAASEPGELARQLMEIINMFPAKYMMTYSSNHAPQLIQIKAEKLGLEDTWSDSSGYSPDIITFTNLKDGSIVAPGPMDVVLNLSMLTGDANKVILDINGKTFEKQINPGDTEIKVSVNFAEYADQDILIQAKVLNSSNEEIAASLPINLSIKSSVSEIDSDELIDPLISQEPRADEQGATQNSTKKILIGILIGIGLIVFFLSLIAIGFLLYKFNPQFKQFINQKIVPNIRRFFSRISKQPFGQTHKQPLAKDPGEILYRLTILQSPNPSMVGRILTISKKEFSIGRDASNDLPIPGDRKVSRHHIKLIAKTGLVYLVEQEKALRGGNISPLYGTYVQGKRISNNIRLYDGNIITLGQSTSFSISLVD